MSFVDERQFMTVIQPVLSLHECADHALAEFTAESLQSVTDPAAIDPTAVESAIKPLHPAADSTGSGAALTKTFCLCVQV
jgi:hypothetical protein